MTSVKGILCRRISARTCRAHRSASRRLYGSSNLFTDQSIRKLSARVISPRPISLWPWQCGSEARAWRDQGGERSREHARARSKTVRLFCPIHQPTRHLIYYIKGVVNTKKTRKWIFNTVWNDCSVRLVSCSHSDSCLLQVSRNGWTATPTRRSMFSFLYV